MGDHLGNQKQIREAMVVRPGQSGQYYDAVVAGLLQILTFRSHYLISFLFHIRFILVFMSYIFNSHN